MKRFDFVWVFFIVALFSMPVQALAARAHPWANVSKKMYDCKRAMTKVMDQAEIAEGRLQNRIDHLDDFNKKKKRAGQRAAMDKSARKDTLRSLDKAAADLEAAIKEYKQKCNVVKKMVKQGVGFGD